MAVRCRTRIRISTPRDSNGWLPPVARHGGLQRLRRLHHRYRVLITADRLDVEHPSLLLLFLPLISFDHPHKDIGTSILILGVLEILFESRKFLQCDTPKIKPCRSARFAFSITLCASPIINIGSCIIETTKRKSQCLN